jgi:hypothetical protein
MYGTSPYASAPYAALGEVQLFGAVTATLDDAVLTATGKVDIAATLSATLANVALSSTAALDIVASLSSTLDDATLVAAFTVETEAESSVTLDDVTCVAAAALQISAVLGSRAVGGSTYGAATYSEGPYGALARRGGGVLEDCTLHADSTISLNIDADAGGYPEHKPKKKRKTQKDKERELEKILDLVLAPKRTPQVKEGPWLLEPIPEPIVLPIPEFNPRIVALNNEVERLRAELEHTRFLQAQEEADMELLLLAGF